MLMTISQPRIITHSDKIRLTSTIRLEKEAECELRELWFEVEQEYAEYLCDERSDAFLVGMLQYAMRFGYDIKLAAPVTAELLYNLKNHLIPTLCEASSNKWHHPQIMTDITIEPLENASGVGTGMSCGVDSFHATLTHLTNEEGQPKLTHLFINSIGSFDANYGKIFKGAPTKEEIKEATFLRARRIARELDLPLVESDSNIYEVYDHRFFSKIHTFSTAFSVLALQKLWRTYLFAGTWGYADFSLHRHDRKDCAWYDLLTLNCVSTRHLRFYSEGSLKSRVDKTLYIAENSIAQQELHVCIKAIENCGICMKCRRTMLTLDAIGRLGDFSNSFPVDYYRENHNDYLRWLAKKIAKKDAFSMDIYATLLEKGMHLDALQPMIREFEQLETERRKPSKQEAKLLASKKEVRQLKRRINKMQKSASWRLTKPFRKVTKMLKGS